MRCEGCGDAVGFPDIHLSATRAMVADSGVYAVAGRSPTFYIGLLHGRLAKLVQQRGSANSPDH